MLRQRKRKNMSELTPYERSWLDVLDELRSCAEIHMTRDHEGRLNLVIGDAQKAFAELAEWDGIALPHTLQKYYMRFSSLAACWWFGESESEPLIGGEFDITHIYKAIQADPPEHRWPNPSPEQQQLISELRDFDGTSLTGLGHVTSLRLPHGAEDLEIWFHDVPRDAHKMDLGYCGYLDALCATKGTFGWQYLFTDVSLADEELEVTAERLSHMLDIFPRLFPDYDYSDLHARLRERM
ncbi:hypothetical protein [Streptomyces sp. NPDC101150]|uniref:hypothetical protein n=1 Tax=Streptomyces sp. NPDC101150 TaxID=3366114 RepID=UPI00382411BA